MNEKYKNFLIDTMSLLIEDMHEAKEGLKLHKNSFNEGRMLSYYEVFSTLKNQLFAFEIDEKEVGLDKINLDKDIGST